MYKTTLSNTTTNTNVDNIGNIDLLNILEQINYIHFRWNTEQVQYWKRFETMLRNWLVLITFVGQKGLIIFALPLQQYTLSEF